VPWRARTIVQLPVRWRARRPQLKRDPLDSARAGLRAMRKSLFVLGHTLVLCSSQSRAQTPATGGALIEFRAVRTTPAPGFSFVKSVADTSFYLADSTFISDEDIEDAGTDTSALNPGLLMLEVRLKPSAAARLHDFTQRHVGERLAVLLNGELTGPPPRIMDPIPGPTLSIFGLPLSKKGEQFAAAIAARWHSRH